MRMRAISPGSLWYFTNFLVSLLYLKECLYWLACWDLCNFLVCQQCLLLHVDGELWVLHCESNVTTAAALLVPVRNSCRLRWQLRRES